MPPLSHLCFLGLSEAAKAAEMERPPRREGRAPKKHTWERGGYTFSAGLTATSVGLAIKMDE
jgi:hypothetical protein